MMKFKKKKSSRLTPEQGQRRKLMKQCDVLWSKIIRYRTVSEDYPRGRCELAGQDRIRCSTVLQAAHLITRSAHQIRLDTSNGRCLCSGHHVYYTNNSDEWDDICLKHWGDEYKRLKALKWLKSSKTDLSMMKLALNAELNYTMNHHVHGVH